MRKLKLEVPTSFQLGGHTIKVEIVPGTEHEKAGVWLVEESKIRLFPKGRTYDFMMQTFCHELGHAICDVWCLTSLNDNEDSIDALGQGFFQFMKTAKYNG